VLPLVKVGISVVVIDSTSGYFHPTNLLDSGFTTSCTLLIKGSGIKDSDYIGVGS